MDKNTIKLDDAILFNAGVDCMFFVKVLETATAYWNSDEKRFNVATHEALRRSVALMESIFTEQITIE